jgi:hypothetical protein
MTVVGQQVALMSYSSQAATYFINVFRLNAVSYGVQWQGSLRHTLVGLTHIRRLHVQLPTTLESLV